MSQSPLGVLPLADPAFHGGDPFPVYRTLRAQDVLYRCDTPGFWAVPRVIATSENKDPSEIVIDEVAGQWLAMCFTVIPLWRHGVSILDAWPAFVVPFLLFRLFDIWKPWLVGRADRRGDGAGVMLDDLWAGLFAGVVSVILAGLYHAVLEPML